MFLFLQSLWDFPACSAVSLRTLRNTAVIAENIPAAAAQSLSHCQEQPVASVESLSYK
jgi:hypothetical protein